MNTTIYLIRHSTRLSTQRIDEYNNNDSTTLKREKIILSVSGEKRAETLANEAELQNIDKIYASNCVRTLQTAKYMMANQITTQFQTGSLSNLSTKIIKL